MIKDKNFTINRANIPNMIRAKDIKVGDVFEREGSLHMRVTFVSIPPMSQFTPPGKIWVCNLNTGNVFAVPDDEKYVIVKRCEVNYELGN